MKYKELFLIFIFLSIIGIFTLPAQHNFMHGKTFATYGRGYDFNAPNRVVQKGHGEHAWDIIVKNSGTYSIDHDYGVPFINFFWENGTRERFLMLINENYMFLYSDNTMPVFRGLRNGHMTSNGGEQGGLIQLDNVTASSTLREGNNVYAATPDRLDFHINRVWAVEGGVGEKLLVKLYPGSGGMFISIGYVHFSRPYLFLQNSRPKKIRVSRIDEEFLESEQYVEYELLDTPNLQDISPPWGSGTIQIEILEIFPGTVNNHMCINTIVSYYAP